MIDIWQFGLSDLLLQHDEVEVRSQRLAHALKESYAVQDFRIALEIFVQATLNQRAFDLAAFAHLMAAADLSFEALYRGYVGKNVLNFFRQDHGYKDGSYQKIWNGREDNEHLVELMAELDVQTPTFKDDLYAGLKARYAAVG